MKRGRAALLLTLGLLAAGLVWAASNAGPPPQPAPALPAVTVQVPPPLRVLGSTPIWVDGTDNQVTPTEDAFRELYAGRADVVLGTLPPPPPPAGVMAPVSVPVGVYAVSVAYSLPGVTLRLDVPTLCRLLSGDISMWNDPGVARLNPGAALPALPVLVSARTARNGTALAVAGACVAAGVWPLSAWSSGWSLGAAFQRATLGAQRIDLTLPGTVAVFAMQATPARVQVASLIGPDGTAVPPRSELGVEPLEVPGRVTPLSGWPFGPPPPANVPGAYPLRGLVWASYLPEQAYRGRPLDRAQAILSLASALRGWAGPGVAGVPAGVWGVPYMTYRGVRVGWP